ncbi:MAG: hypothetical protein ACO1OB_32115 [Archangium sp.]
MRSLTLCALLMSCAPTNTVQLTFGEAGEGLDGFMCKDKDDRLLLERVPEDRMASLVFDFIDLKGVPGCRTGQLVEWCRTRNCVPRPEGRSCARVRFETPEKTRAALRAQLLEAMKAVRGHEASDDAPNDFVLVRVVGTTESCEVIENRPTTEPLDPAQLLGCAYSCPVLLDRVETSVFLGFDGFVDNCSQGVLICSAEKLTWKTEAVDGGAP